MKVLVSGGAGFIGSHIVDALIKEGHEVVVVDDLSTGNLENVNPHARMYNVSVTNPQTLETVFACERPQIVNHHAAQTSLRISMANPSSDAKINVIGSMNLLNLSVKYQATRFIFASSCAVYTEPYGGSMNEAHPTDPQSAYGISKRAAEDYVRLYDKVHGLRSKIFRYGNVFGPRQNSDGEAGVVPIFMEQLLSSIQPTIFGDGTKTRDYVFVTDVVRANLMAMGENGDGETFNIANGTEVSDLEVFETVRQAIGITIDPIYAQKRPGEHDRIRLDCSKAKRIWGWTPKVSFADGVRLTLSHRLRNR